MELLKQKPKKHPTPKQLKYYEKKRADADKYLLKRFTEIITIHAVNAKSQKKRDRCMSHAEAFFREINAQEQIQMIKAQVLMTHGIDLDVHGEHFDPNCVTFVERTRSAKRAQRAENDRTGVYQ